MSNQFGDLSNDGLEQTEDRLGGGGFKLETDIYTGPIKLAYAGKTDGGSKFMTFVFDFDGKEFKHTEYATNKQGQNFFMVKDKDKKETGKKAPLPGFTVINDICLATVEQELKDINFEDKMVNIYDYDLRKEVAKSVPVAIDLLGKVVSLAIVKTVENKTEMQGNERVTTNDTQDVNSIEKVFNTESKLTLVEAREGKPPEFWNMWLEKNKGVTRDKTAKNGVKSGKPGGAAPTAGGTERKSLFSK